MSRHTAFELRAWVRFWLMLDKVRLMPVNFGTTRDNSNLVSVKIEIVSVNGDAA